MALKTDKREFSHDKEKVSKMIILLKEMIIKINQAITNENEQNI
jgi:hypothetical protein